MSERKLSSHGFKYHSGQLTIAVSRSPSVVNTIHSYIYIYIYICLYIYIYIYLHTHTHTHIYIYIYIYIHGEYHVYLFISLHPCHYLCKTNTDNAWTPPQPSIASMLPQSHCDDEDGRIGLR